jgi:hypothetical protein
MFERGLPRAVRFNSERLTLTDVNVLVRDGKKARYQLVSLPIYLAWSLTEILSRLPPATGSATPPR